MRYRPDLDGIRALAVLAVILNHSNIGRFNGGWMGVDVFFVLSGYLITTLLLRERQDTQRIDFKAFYMRRALRLFPALIGMLILSIPFYRDIAGDLTEYAKGAIAAAFYFHDLTSGYHVFGSGVFGHTWSLSVEEQFYLVWPPVLAWLLIRRRDPFVWAAAAALVSWGLLAYNCRAPGPEGYPTGYYLPWDRAGQLLAGVCVATTLHRGWESRLLARPAAGWAVGVGMVLVVAAGSHWFRNPNLWWEAPAIAILTALLVAHLTLGDSGVKKILSVKPLTFLGRRSYGIYLYIVTVNATLQVRLISHVGQAGAIAVEVVVIVAAAALSYQYIELPFLRLKHRRYEPPSHRPEPVPT